MFFFGGGGFRGVCPHVYISNLRNSSCKGTDQREEEQGVACECPPADADRGPNQVGCDSVDQWFHSGINQVAQRVKNISAEEHKTVVRKLPFFSRQQSKSNVRGRGQRTPSPDWCAAERDRRTSRSQPADTGRGVAAT